MFAFLTGNRAADMSAAEAVEKSRAGEIVVIDIRDGMELKATGKAKGALHVPMAAFKMRCDPSSPECLPELKSGKPIAVYCASGARSGMAKGMLKRFGYEDVHNIGGLAHWQRAGGAIER
ncbi:rhodanese-like domain-containing protein [Salipiger sp. P9]|uniref:rhodanese-like domain-containing protein n=1 Tax=Salipiger pentaromativorans TaxID=2943193 RepID=UPI00215873AA|nr:rhodanese-like domain-containing protein [Salipiger pentaromativorans]MCR8547255.1 rhodanese-like domain-containing protein [Salipiger pentaromativorans]